MDSLQRQVEQSEQWGQGEPPPEARGLPLRALLWSLALHAGLLASWPAPPEDAVAQGVPATALQGVLLPAPSKLATPPPVVAVKPQIGSGPVRKVRPAVTAPKAALPPVVAVLPAPTFSAPVTTPDAGGKIEPDGLTGLAAQATNAAAPVNLAPASALAVSAAGPDPAGLRQYRLALAGEARRFRSYPEAARRAGMSGTTEVRIAVAAGGQAARAELSRSSGHAALDTAALEMLRQAATRAALPAALRGQSFAVLLPVVFAVEE